MMKGSEQEAGPATVGEAAEIAAQIKGGGSVRLFAPKGIGNIGVTLPDGTQKQFHPRDDGSVIARREYVPALLQAGLSYRPFE